MNNSHQEQPIFIAGLPRSGTSLMRGIIGSHPDVAIFQWDLPLWTSIYGNYKRKDISKEKNLNSLINNIVTNNKAINCDVKISFQELKDEITQQKTGDITIGFVFQCYLKKYAAIRKKPIWGLKMPNNEFFADKIFEAYPNAKMIQMIRDPRDVAVSFQSYSAGSWIYVPYRHIREWKKSVHLSGKYEKEFERKYVAVVYEDLVKNPEKEVERICNAIDFEFDPKMLRANDHPGWKGSNSFFDDIGKQSQELSSQGIGRYKKKLKPFLTAHYNHLLHTELVKLGYETDENSHQIKPQYIIQFVFKCIVSEVLLIVNKLKKFTIKMAKKILFWI